MAYEELLGVRFVVHLPPWVAGTAPTARLAGPGVVCASEAREDDAVATLAPSACFRRKSPYPTKRWW